MKTLTIKGSIREELGKAATKRLRKQGEVPCVLYGGENVVHFHAPLNDFRHLLYTPNVYFVDLELGDNTYQAIMKDSQFHPVTDTVIHLDFFEIKEGKAMDMKIPVHLCGLAEGVKEGGVLKQDYRYLKVRALPKDMPETIEIDISPLTIGDSVKVGDLEIENASIHEKENVSVVGIVAVRGIAEIEAEAAAAAEAAEEEEEGEAEEGEEGEEGAEEAAKEGEEASKDEGEKEEKSKE
ncbi:MAG: 50S ribosomal protein L25/general stress protein Ctc [Candidatus Delongbacteria bacterium]|jgi:large subunit ribosomal protein L25|nr:50S ribosomal protein L25/general stress protein Ctc [Candidatus Delongbacteria bacterium]